MSEIFACDFAGKKITIKTNYMAGQADGAALVCYGDTMVLVTAVSLKSGREGLDFLPLTVDYQELTYAAGKIPGGFFKREGRPNEKEILTSRLIDRSIRPLIPKGYFFETQLVANVFSTDNDHDSTVAAMLGASAALTLSDIPFKGPIAGIRVARIDGQLVCNPSLDELSRSDINLYMTGRKIVPGTQGREFDVNLVMLEGDAREASEEDIVAAITFGLEAVRPVIVLQDAMREAIGKEKRPVPEVVIDEGLVARVDEIALEGVKTAYRDATQAGSLCHAGRFASAGRQGRFRGRSHPGFQGGPGLRETGAEGSAPDDSRG
jgi:polyribonucleotide nucleotidyltransferase